MSIGAEALTSYKKIDEAYIDGLLKKEIEASNPSTQTGIKTASGRGLTRRTACSMS